MEGVIYILALVISKFFLSLLTGLCETAEYLTNLLQWTSQILKDSRTFKHLFKVKKISLLVTLYDNYASLTVCGRERDREQELYNSVTDSSVCTVRIFFNRSMYGKNSLNKCLKPTFGELVLNCLHVIACKAHAMVSLIVCHLWRIRDLSFNNITGILPSTIMNLPALNFL